MSKKSWSRDREQNFIITSFVINGWLLRGFAQLKKTKKPLTSKLKINNSDSKQQKENELESLSFQFGST